MTENNQRNVEMYEQDRCNPGNDFKLFRKALQNSWATCDDPGTNNGYF